MNWAHKRYCCIYSQRRQIRSRGVRTRACVRFSHTPMSPRFAPAYCHVPASKQNRRTERVIRLTVHICALCIYRKYRTGTYSAECRGRTVVKRVNTWGRRGTRGPTLCTRRESMRVQVRKNTVVRRRGGGSVEEEKREMARPKVKPNSFSVRLEAALTLRLSATPYHESLPDLPCLRVCVFSLCILYKRTLCAHAWCPLVPPFLLRTASVFLALSGGYAFLTLLLYLWLSSYSLFYLLFLNI